MPKNVTVREAHQKQGEGFTYVDVRSIPEFVQAHPQGAVNVPLLHHDERTGRMTPNPEFLDVMKANFTPDAKLLIGCQAGGRSAHAADALARAGYTNVFNVLGGFGGARDPITGAVGAEGWAQAGLPVDSGDTEGRSFNDLRGRLTKNGR